VVAVGALELLHRDVAAVLTDWIRALRVDPDNYYVHLVVKRLGVVDDRLLTAVSAASLFGAAVLVVEGVGLCLRKRWAEYMTVILTISTLPLEFYALSRHLSLAKAAVTLLNLAIAWYLIRRIRRENRERREGAAGEAPTEPNEATRAPA
jgi:uncharacterized membrane protein (DUF2068 family)